MSKGAAMFRGWVYFGIVFTVLSTGPCQAVDLRPKAFPFMKAAFDEIMATAVKRQHEPQRIVGDLLNAEISEKQARSIKYQLTIAKLPLANDLDVFNNAPPSSSPPISPSGN